MDLLAGPATPRLSKYFRSYAADHQHPKNVLCHQVAIPMIMVTLFGMLAPLRVGPLDGGGVLMILATTFYLYLDWRITLPYLLFAGSAYLVGREMAMTPAVTLFVLAWVIQFVGHFGYEKRSPSFFKNLEQLLIGPLWVFAKWVGYTKGS